MKITLKKTEVGSLRTLDEKEIQKRLYGRYHRDGMTPAANSNAKSIPPRFETKHSSGSSFSFLDWLDGFKRVRGHAQGLFLQFGRKFPWKFATIVTAALIVSIILFQALSVWFGKIKAISYLTPNRTTVPKSASLVDPVGVNNREGKTPLPQTALERPTGNTPNKEVQQKSYYAVQVCTYEREVDAQQLVNELRGLNFPAFYLRFISSQQRITHYVVFLGKQKTYAQADVELGKFRKTKDFQRFPDSFIRSI